MSRRYPLTPLLDAAGLSLTHAVRALGLGGPEYRKYRDEGMTREVAERKALKVGLHPYEVWPEMVEHDLIECAAPDCGERFDPQAWSQKPRRFCSRTCQQRTNARERYQQDEATRERRKATSRRYKAEVRELMERRAS